MVNIPEGSYKVKNDGIVKVPEGTEGNRTENIKAKREREYIKKIKLANELAEKYNYDAKKIYNWLDKYELKSIVHTLFILDKMRTAQVKINEVDNNNRILQARIYSGPYSIAYYSAKSGLTIKGEYKIIPEEKVFIKTQLKQLIKHEEKKEAIEDYKALMAYKKKKEKQKELEKIRTQQAQEKRVRKAKREEKIKTLTKYYEQKRKEEQAKKQEQAKMKELLNKGGVGYTSISGEEVVVLNKNEELFTPVSEEDILINELQMKGYSYKEAKENVEKTKELRESIETLKEYGKKYYEKEKEVPVFGQAFSFARPATQYLSERGFEFGSDLRKGLKKIGVDIGYFGQSVASGAVGGISSIPQFAVDVASPVVTLAYHRDKETAREATALTLAQAGELKASWDMDPVGFSGSAIGMAISGEFIGGKKIQAIEKTDAQLAIEAKLARRAKIESLFEKWDYNKEPSLKERAVNKLKTEKERLWFESFYTNTEYDKGSYIELNPNYKIKTKYPKVVRSAYKKVIDYKINKELKSYSNEKAFKVQLKPKKEETTGSSTIISGSAFGSRGKVRVKDDIVLVKTRQRVKEYNLEYETPRAPQISLTESSFFNQFSTNRLGFGQKIGQKIKVGQTTKVSSPVKVGQIEKIGQKVKIGELTKIRQKQKLRQKQKIGELFAFGELPAFKIKVGELSKIAQKQKVGRKVKIKVGEKQKTKQKVIVGLAIPSLKNKYKKKPSKQKKPKKAKKKEAVVPDVTGILGHYGKKGDILGVEGRGLSFNPFKKTRSRKKKKKGGR